MRIAHSLEAISHYVLGGSVHRRGVDHTPAVIEEGLQDLDPFVSQTRAAADIEGDPRAHAEDGDGFAGRRNGAHGNRPRRGSERQAAERKGQSGGGKRQNPASTERVRVHGLTMRERRAGGNGEARLVGACSAI